jgi:cytochrome P450
MIHYDPYMPEIKENPHAIYKRMRAESPIYYIERFDAWALALFEDIWEASADAEHYSVKNEMSNITLLERKPAAFESLPSLDPPVHDVLRRRLFPHFSPAAARRLGSSPRCAAGPSSAWTVSRGASTRSPSSRSRWPCAWAARSTAFRCRTPTT